MITNKTAAKIAELSAQPVMGRLSSTAYKQVVECFCMQHCGHTPDGELCDEAEGIHRRFLSLLFEAYSRFN